MGCGAYLFRMKIAMNFCGFLKKNTFRMIPYFRRMSIDFHQLFQGNFLRISVWSKICVNAQNYGNAIESINFSAKQIIDGHVKQIRKFYEVFKRRFGLTFFIADIGRLRNSERKRDLSLSQLVEFSLFYECLLKSFHRLYY